MLRCISHMLSAPFSRHTASGSTVTSHPSTSEQKYSEFEQRAVAAESKLAAKSKHVSSIEEALKKAQADLAGSRRAYSDMESMGKAKARADLGVTNEDTDD